MKSSMYPGWLKCLLLCLMFCTLYQWQANACEGTPRPPCGRTMWLTILTPKNIAIPQNGQINIPIILVPYVFWNTNAGCAQPALTANSSILERSSINLQVAVEVKFVSANTGNLQNLGIQMFNLPAPTVPGLQTMNAVIIVPDGQLDRDDVYTGQFDATATVTFTSGVGAGTLSASASAQAYLVQPMPGFPEIPRVNIEYVPVSENDPGYMECRRGDQAYLYFLVTNNDMTNSVTLDLSTQVGQVAGLPDGFDPANAQNNFNAGVYAISDPTGDYFNHKFVKNPATWELLPEGDPHLNPASLDQQITLSAGRSRFVAICIRSFGMCANGSCNKVALLAQGQFSDGKLALACASSAIVIDDAAPKSRRCEIQDDIKTDINAAACFSKSIFVDANQQSIPHATTNAYGNVNPGNNDGGWWLYGENVTTEPGMFDMVSDYIRFDENVEVSGVLYSVQFSGMTGTAINVVAISPLPSEAGSSLAIPVIRYLPNALITIAIRPDVDSILIQTISGGMTVFEGKLSEFLENPPPNFILEETTCRTFRKVSDFSGREICTDIYSFNKLHKLGQNPDHSIEVVDQNGMSIQGTVSIAGGFVEPPTQNFNGTISFNLVKAALPFAPQRAIGYFTINSPGTLSPRVIPFASSRFERQSYIITNEEDLVNVICAVQARNGHVDISFAPSRGDLALTNFAASKGDFAGDAVFMNGNIRAPGGDRNALTAVIIDGSACPPPCDVFKFVGDGNHIENIQFINFPQNALTMMGDQNSVASCIFQDNGGSGVVIAEGVDNTISAGSFYNNGGLGIDLGADGFSGNDPADIDTGANHLQNFPVLTRASLDVDGGTFIQGTINSTPKTLLNLQFYTSTTCNGSGFGEGELFMTEMQVMTNALGDASFSFTAETESAMGMFITATTTDPDGNTSEFSACQEVLGTTAVQEVISENALRVYPNPVGDILKIRMELDNASDVNVELLSSFGMVISSVYEGYLMTGTHTLMAATNRLPHGLYFLRALIGDEERILRVVVQ
ncbi:MAG TPA: T9SS type A sorting domain-containing protein [Saprospiraceae bacterium]|nr:T9SS type A sorting domain-containing protein [Saprospiraceae bacterium]